MKLKLLKSPIGNVATFGPVLGEIRAGYEAELKKGREERRFLQITNRQLYQEIQRFQEEISSDDEQESKDAEPTNLLERIRTKREKEKSQRLKKYAGYEDQIAFQIIKTKEIERRVERLNEEMKKKDGTNARLCEELISVQRKCAALKAEQEQVLLSSSPY